MTKQTLIDKIAAYSGLTVADIFSKKRKREIVDARYICYAALYNFLGMNLSQIAYYFNSPSHVSIKHGVESVWNLRERNILFNKIFEDMGLKIGILHADKNQVKYALNIGGNKLYSEDVQKFNDKSDFIIQNTLEIPLHRLFLLLLPLITDNFEHFPEDYQDKITKELQNLKFQIDDTNKQLSV